MRNNWKDKVHVNEFFLLFEVQPFFQILSDFDVK